MDLGAYLEPRDANPPSGENLEYDPAFTDLELAAQPGEEQQMGDEVKEAQEQDWGDVRDKALAVMEQSHDIRAGVFLAEAVLNTKGLTDFADVTKYLRALLEDYWDSCHPELDEDDGDATMRINAVAGIAGSDRVLRALRRTALTDSRMFGRITLRHIEVAEGTANMPPDLDDVPDAASVSAAFQDTDDEVLADSLAAINAALEDVDAIDNVFVENTPGEGPTLDPLKDTLKKLQRALAKHSGAEVPAEAADDDAGAPAAGGGAVAAPSGGGGGGAINSPADVTMMLDRIMDYYARTEPSSPVPILLDRAKRLVSADFLTIIEDMAKEGLSEVRRIGGIKGSDDYDY
ncbi:type VI secretion system protein TssA [Ruegeria jejuensis]|uniref:type VI secretion system protein TssA n=1 Tax=Ruegeria jejuensis TaxID=3233338 RepID=UPI00355BF2CB